MSRESHGIDRIQVTFDDEHLFANAGLLLVSTLAVRLQLERLVNETVRLSGLRILRSPDLAQGEPNGAARRAGDRTAAFALEPTHRSAWRTLSVRGLVSVVSRTLRSGRG